MTIDDAEALLRARFGFDAERLGRPLIQAAVTRLAREAGLSEEDYGLRLRDAPEWLQALADAVVVHETWMLRDGGPFALIASEAAQWRRTRFHAAHPLRVLCVACATGEEAWSVAMALAEAGLSPDDFVVEGVDLSARALATAQAATYSARAFRTPEAEQWRARWCEPVAAGWRMIPALRQSVRFEQANLFDVAWQTRVARAHLVFCRNVLIYFDGAARDRALRFLRSVMDDSALLFTGHAEAAFFAAEFTTFGPLGAFAFSREAPVARAVSSPRANPPPAATIDSPRHAPRTPVPAAPLKRPPAMDDLALASRLADQGRYAEALVCVERALDHDRTNPKGWLLKALSEQALGNDAAAGNSFSRTLYLEPQNEVALLALARLETLAGRPDHARRLRERAARGALPEVRG